MTRKEFVQHVQATQHNLRRFLTALCCGDTAMADDLAQETYIKAYLRCETLRQTQSFAPWIYRIAYNTFVSHQRGQRQDTLSADAATHIEAEDSSDHAFRYQPLYTALSQLSHVERTSVTLHYLEGYAIKEIAEITDSTTEAVKQQLSRGRNHLRHLLTPQKNV